ncbi:hypothetical protein PIB30_082842 [Stylosanthes scabra]|uniref:Uncharacterized protein n=1 Tax=Stylosanthes scabra TaxID=79078 RepID=A0ABU6YRM4_9FABA|nr:hypothetical protein [Stylosanthes scabra]
MQTNAEKGRPMFYGCLKSDYGATSSSQVDPQEPVPLRTAPPSPGKMKKGSLRSKKGRIWSILDRAPMPRRGASRLGVQSYSPRPSHPRLGTPRRDPTSSKDTQSLCLGVQLHA